VRRRVGECRWRYHRTHCQEPIRKEDIISKVLAVRGDHPGLVYIISAMEACESYKPWHDKQTHRTFLRPDAG
jgi:hypothetical protein